MGLFQNAVNAIDATMHAYYKLDQTSGDSVPDSGSVGGTMNLSGAENTAFRWGGGIDGRSLECLASFAGWDTASFATPLLTNSTITFWFKRNGRPASDLQPLYYSESSNNNFASTSRCRIESTDGKFYWNPRINGASGTEIASTNDICDNRWHFIAITRAGSTYRLYVDGVQNAVASDYNSSNVVSSGAFNFGMASTFFDEVAIFDSTLTAQQVADLYNSTVPATTEYSTQVSSLAPTIWFKMDDSGLYPFNYGSSSLQIPSAPGSGTATPLATSNVSNTAYSFNGTSDFLNWSGVIGSEVLANGTFTGEAWFKTASVGGSTRVIAVWGLSTINGRFTLQLNSSGNPQVVYGPRSGATTVTLTHGVNMADNNWHHIVATVRDTGSNFFNVYLYIDGQLVSSSTGNAGQAMGTDADGTLAQRIIGRGLGTVFYWNGQIDEVAYYSGELTAAQIESNYYASALAARSLPAPMTASAEFIEIPKSVNILADPLNVNLAQFPDAVITTTSDVSVAWLPATVNAEFVNPNISVDETILADPALATNAEFVNPAVSININFSANSLDVTNAELIMPTITGDANFAASPMTASSFFENPTISVSEDLSVSFMFAGSEFVQPLVFIESIILADPMTASAEFVNPALEISDSFAAGIMTASAEFVNAVVNISEGLLSPAFEASAEFVNPSINVDEANQAGVMTASAEILPGIVDTTTNINISADPMIATLATMPDSVITTTSNVSQAWLPDTVNAEFVNPSVLAQANITLSVAPMLATAEGEDVGISTETNFDFSAAPFTASAETVNPAVSINEIIIVPATLNATARKTIDDRGTAAWDGWDTDLTNDKKNADGWHGFGITNADGAATAPFTYLDDPLLGEIQPIREKATWSTSSWGSPFGALHNTLVYKDIEFTFGPEDDGIYAVKGIENLPDAYFTAAGLPQRTTINYKTLITCTTPQATGYKNVGLSTYTAAVNVIKGFSYEFLFKTTDTNAVLASGAVTDRDTLNTYWSEFRIENGYPVFEYIVTNTAGTKLKEFKFTGSDLVNTGEYKHLLIQTNKNDGLQQNLESLSPLVDKAWTDPIFTISQPYNSIDIYVDGNLSSKNELNYSELYDDTTNVSIGNILTVGRSFSSIASAQNNVGNPVYYSESLTTNKFTGTWAGMVRRTTDVVNTQIVGAVSPTTLVNGIVSLSNDDINIMANLALKNRMKFADANDGATATMVNPTISTNTKKLLRLYFFGEDATNEMFGVNSNLHNVVTYSVINEVSTDKDKLFNADKAYLSGAANPETDSAEVIVDAWKNSQGYHRFINLQTDIPEYNEIDGIIFMDYPDNGVEFDALMPGYGNTWVSDRYDDFISSLREAVNDGKGLFVSSSKLAADLKIVSGVQEITQDIESSVTISDPFGDSLGDIFYDTNRNNKYKIVAQEQDLTTLASHIMTDFISHSGDLTDDYHVKYANRPDGLQVGDKLIIPSLPLMKAQLLTDLAGDTSNRLGENTLEVFASTDILAGRPIAELGDTGYITTIILEPGDVLNGEVIGGKIIVNCVEDGLAMGLDEYNYGYRQVVSQNDSAENATTIQWQYSTSRTTRKLEPLTISPDTKGQTFPTEGGGGPIIQAATHSSAGNIRTKFDKANETFTSGIYFDVNSEIYDLDKIPVYSMTYRGINWLLQPSDRQGTFVGEESATAQATFVQPTTTTQIIVPLPAKNATISATPSTASAVFVTNIAALYGNANTITLTLHQQDVITLYIEKERL